MRQDGILRDLDPRQGVSVASLACEYPCEFLIPEHAHGSDQLIYATSGVMEVHSDRTMWLIPPSFAVWVPAGIRHRIRMPMAVSMRTLYFRPGLVRREESTCAVLSVTSLLRELVLEIVRAGQLRFRNREHCALRDLVVLRIIRASSVPTEIRMPREPRAYAAATWILDHLTPSPSLQAVCSEVGVSTRTLQRLFRNEVGIDADSWRRQMRLTKGIEFLVAGLSVKQAAFAVGYNQPSAFVSAFRRTFGMTPRMWVDKMCNPQES
jgi:AraC-like DNA-binding protein